ncbi:RHS repeat-associated core domain-containing protein [Pseudomonas sp. dw_612]|uniref:RHS repeat domain-containing protein n=1 Tax=Pseudomonas sp. dw_612 TaxID=2720080 RepID=UPI001BD64CE9|nr:RHS repeat-associated core domain-containing protein [Pseudomonas sp. dw_612]
MQMPAIHRRTPRLIANDPRGLPARVVDYLRHTPGEVAQPRINRTFHDAAGRAVREWDPRLWQRQSDDPSGPANVTTVHSLTGQVLHRLSVDAGPHVMLLGVAGQTLLQWDGRGTRQRSEYDELLRPRERFEQARDQAEHAVERFQYGAVLPELALHNQCGKLIRHDDPAGILHLNDYNLLGDNTEQTRVFEDAQFFTTRWRFNPSGTLLEQVDARGNHQKFSLTLDGQLRAVQLQLDGQVPWQTLVSDIRYDAEGRIVEQTAGNGVQTTCRYRTADGRLLERQAEDANARVLQHLVYDYDPMGNVLSIEDRAQPVRYFANQRVEPISHFAYDSLYRLIEASGRESGGPSQGPQSMGRVDPSAISNYRQTYDYDEGDNLLKLTHVGAQSPGHQLEAARYSNRCLPWRGDVPPTEEQIAAAFDANGNLRELEPGRALTWNLRNQLQSVSPVQRASGLDDSESYTYDGAGQRVRKVRLLHTSARAVTADACYLPGLELRTDAGTGEVWQVITAVAGLSEVRVLHWESAPPSGIANDQYRYSLSDHLRSCTMELSAQASIISQEVYYPFGDTAWFAADNEVEARYRFVRYSGKERDATGLYYYGYRYYLPWLQRWLNPDPAGGIDGHNRYRAMRNNPLVYEDPDGRTPNKTSSTEPRDQMYHDLAERGLVTQLQAAGMQPIRNFFEQSPDRNVQAYRREIPRALEELGAKDSSNLMNTHQAHVIAAARTNTASPSGAVLYHAGELISSVMSRVIGENLTSQVMGPLSEAFNSPVGSPEVLAARRGTVASVFVVGGTLAMRAKHPVVQALGAASVAAGNLMKQSEEQTVIQYRILIAGAFSGASTLGSSTQASTIFEESAIAFGRQLDQVVPGARPSLFVDVPEPEATPPGPLAQQLFAVAFGPTENEQPLPDAPRHFKSRPAPSMRKLSRG